LRAGVGTVGLVGVGWVMHTQILEHGRPIGERKAFDLLSLSIHDFQRIQFDSRLSAADRELILKSKASDWTLYFANPTIVGYDFNLATSDGRFLGVRVKPRTVWNANEKVWAFQEFARRPASDQDQNPKD